MSKKAKYSIEDRMHYYGDVPFSDTNKSRYGTGYYHVLRTGKLPKNLDKCNKYFRLGAINGMRALEKSKKIKF